MVLLDNAGNVLSLPSIMILLKRQSKSFEDAAYSFGSEYESKFIEYLIIGNLSIVFDFLC